MRKPKHSSSLVAHFSIIEDQRINRTKEHNLVDILVVSVLAMLCGAEHFTEFEMFGKARRGWLKGFLSLPNGIPSHDTFRRVFMLLDPAKFSECFRNWTESLRESIPEEIVAIDGKTARRTRSAARGTKPIHVVSAWAMENGLVLGQFKVDEKSNEITAIPELLRVLELSGCIVTIDAMGTQKAIATEIRNADADYVLALKGNHETVHDEVRSFLLDAKARSFEGVAHEFLETVDGDHGRIETRRYWITGDVGWFGDLGLWEDLRSFGMVERIRDIDGVVTTETSFYLCSIAPKAELFAKAARGHWSIENSLHWVLDVCFDEDQSRARSGYAAQNLNILRHITLNLLKADKSAKCGIKSKRKLAGWNPTFLLGLLQHRF